MEIIDPSNLSNLLLSKNDSSSSKNIQPYISPSIEIVSPNNSHHNQTNTKTTRTIHGRGLVAKKEFAAGECLFVIPATLNVDVATAMEEFKTSDDDDDDVQSTLEAIAESVLLQAMQEAPFRSTLIRTLVGNHSRDVDIETECPTMQDLLVGTTATTTTTSPEDTANGSADIDLDDTLLNIIRRNAFGPDFVTYSKITDMAASSSSSSSSSVVAVLPSRILGMYPLAAMLNHSCHPNVVRVYKGSIMIAHASERIAPGQELVWSYIPPTTPYLKRQEILQNQHQFTCRCVRCQVEGPVWEHHAKTFLSLQDFNSNTNNNNNDDVNELEETILGVSNKDLTNEAKRYLRMGFCQTLYYIPHLNEHAATTSRTTGDDGVSDDERLLQLCTQLHFTFCACNNASTEHLSVSRISSSRSTDSTSSTQILGFKSSSLTHSLTHSVCMHNLMFFPPL
jgi:hypothetical protein